MRRFQDSKPDRSSAVQLRTTSAIWVVDEDQSLQVGECLTLYARRIPKYVGNSSTQQGVSAAETSWWKIVFWLFMRKLAIHIVQLVRRMRIPNAVRLEVCTVNFIGS